MKNKSVTSVVSVFLDIFCPQYATRHGKRYIEVYKKINSIEWIRKRIEFFRKWTLKSLRNQIFQDFQVFILCSEKSKDLINSHDWDTNIKHCYDYGEVAYKAIDTDYVAITNLDSDDLFHRDAMKTIRENLTLSKKIEYLYTSDYWRWLSHHNCFIHITDPLNTRFGTKWSPCWTLIFPKDEYKDWLNIKKHWFVYNPEICGIKGAKILPPDLVCQIRQKESTHYAMWKEDPYHKNRLAKELESAKKHGRKVTFFSGDHIEILKDFGISEKQYRTK